jgi:hypothetical protein
MVRVQLRQSSYFLESQPQYSSQSILSPVTEPTRVSYRTLSDNSPYRSRTSTHPRDPTELVYLGLCPVYEFNSFMESLDAGDTSNLTLSARDR